MVLRLDSSFAIVWRDPFSLQLGVDPARVVLREVTAAQERMIAALESGISRSGLEMIAHSAGAAAAEVSDLLRRVKPLLVDDSAAVPERRVSIVGAGQTVERIATSLALAGVRVAVTTTISEAECDLAIPVAHYVLDPDCYGFWLRRDLPHLPVVFGDDSVTIGPVVDAGRTPCLYCIEHYRRDADASWPAIASQLWGRRARSETPLVSAEVAARVVRLVLHRLQSASPSARGLTGRSFRIAVDSGEVTRRDWMPHPECGCVELPSELSADQRENGSPRDSAPPTTVSVAAARA